MNSWERLETVFAGRTPDKLPALGGWIADMRALVSIADANVDEFVANPQKVALNAYKNLKVDGLIDLWLAQDIDAYRNLDKETYIHSAGDMDIEDFADHVRGLPEPEKWEDMHNFDEAYQNLKDSIEKVKAINPDVVYMPAQWGLGSYFSWYNEYGYENYFMLIALYPDLARKLLEIGGAKGHFMSRVIAKAVKEGIYPHAVHMGEDICTQRGPMVSVDFLEKYYAPILKQGLEPLREVGCRPVWHSDGDIRSLVPFLLDSGIEGFQGVQPECGVTLDYILEQKIKSGNKPLIFGPMSVTTELPVWTPEQVRASVREVFEKCKDRADLCLFTSNTINPDVPLENIYAMYDEASKLYY